MSPFHEDSPEAVVGSISTLKQIWEVDGAAGCRRDKKQSSNIYAAPSELNAPGCLSVAAAAQAASHEIYADLPGILSGAEELLRSLSSAASRKSAQDKASLLALADGCDAFRGYATLYADSVSATGRFRFRAQLNRMAQMVKELVFLANRSPHHAAKPIIKEVEDITRDLVLLARKK